MQNNSEEYNQHLEATMELVNRRHDCPLTKLWNLYTGKTSFKSRSRSNSKVSVKSDKNDNQKDK